MHRGGGEGYDVTEEKETVLRRVLRERGWN